MCDFSHYKSREWARKLKLSLAALANILHRRQASRLGAITGSKNVAKHSKE